MTVGGKKKNLNQKPWSIPPQVLAEEFYKHVYIVAQSSTAVKTGQEKDNYTESTALSWYYPPESPRYQTRGGVLQVSGASAGVDALTM